MWRKATSPNSKWLLIICQNSDNQRKGIKTYFLKRTDLRLVYFPILYYILSMLLLNYSLGND